MALPATAAANHNALGELMSTGPAGGNAELPAFFKGTSTDGNRVFFETDEALVATDTDSTTDVYQRLNGQPTVLSTGPAGGNGAFAASYAGASADGTKVFFTTREPLVAADSDAQIDIYERSGTTTTLLSTGPSGGNGNRNALFDGATPTGSHVFFHTSESLVAADTDNSVDIYQRSGATTTLLSTGPSGGNGAFAAFFAGASTDGSRVFLETDEKLTSDDTDNETDVYERLGSTTTRLSFGPAGGNGDPSFEEFYDATFAGASADGTKVLIETDEALTSDDVDLQYDVFQRSAGVTTRVSLSSTAGNGEFDASFAGANADASKVWIHTSEALTAGDTDPGYQDVYERSGTTTTLMSTGPTGAGAAFDVSLVGATATGNRVFISTGAALVSADTDGGWRDIYERTGTTTNFLSTGPNDPHGAFNAFFAGASADGTRVFVHSTEPLVAGDMDESTSGGTPAVDEVQTVAIDATGGTFTLTFDGQTTGGIAFDAAPGTVQAALEGLSNIAPGDAVVTGSASDYTVTFGGAYSGFNLPELTGDGASLTGGAGTVTITTTTQGAPAVPEQTVGQQDVYERQSTGAVTLLSVGPTGGNDPLFGAAFAGASADGTKVFIHSGEPLASAFDLDTSQDIWAALINSLFPRPGGGTPLRVPLVPTYKRCLSPNSSHVAPLSNPSCNPPAIDSSQLTTGTAGRLLGTARLDAIPGNVATPADEADFTIVASATDVRKKADGTDYAGDVILRLDLRLTDRGTGTSQGLSGTVGDLAFSAPITCTTTADTAVGSTCSLSTTADTLVPGTVREGNRSVIAALAFRLMDAGPDGLTTPGSGTCPPTCGSGDETPFLEPGVFAP